MNLLIQPKHVRSTICLATLAMGLAGAALQGCGGSAGFGGSHQTSTNPYAGISYTATGFALGAYGSGTLNLKINGNTLSGSVGSSANGAKVAKRAPDTFTFSMTFTGSTASFTAQLSGLANSQISGALPNAPATTGGTFTIDLGGTNYGPFIFGSTVSGTPSYSLALVGLIAPGTDALGNDLNDSGEIVGGGDASPNGVAHAFSWNKTGGLNDLGAFGSNLGASALSVSNGGEIVGQINLNSGGPDYTVPFVVGGSGPSRPGVPPNCDDVRIFGVTNSGYMIVQGYELALGIEQPTGSFAYQNGKYTAIGLNAGPNQADGLSAFNRLTNTAFGSLGSSTSQQATRWKWTDGTTTTFDWAPLQMAIGDTYYTGGANGEWLGTLSNGDAGYISSDGSKTTDLGHKGTVSALNAKGQAVGSYTDASGHSYGFWWTAATGFVDLNTLIDPSLGATIVEATRINATGQILVQVQVKNTTYDYFVGEAGLLTPKM